MMASESSSSSADSYIGSFISLISKYEIRYEGVLYYINTQDCTIGLKDVRSFGTEGRKKDGPDIPPSDKVYEYILFRGSDIKDLQVKSSPPHTEEQIHNDPAIIQSHYSGSPLSSSLASVGGTLIASAQSQDTPALTSRAYPSALPLYQSGAQSSPSGHSQSQTTQIAGGPPFAMPMFWPGHNGNSISTSHAPQQHIPFQPPTTSFPLTVQNPTQDSQNHASTTKGTSNSSEFVSPIPSSISSKSVHPSLSEFVSPIPSSISSNSVHPSFSLTPTPTQCSTSLDMASFLSLNESLPSHSASIPANRLTMSSFSSGQDMNITEAQCIVKAVSDPISSVLPVQSMPYPALSFSGSTPSPLLMAPSALLTLDQLAQPRQHMLSPMPKLYPDQQDTAVMPTSCNSFSAAQAPLLPLPISVRQSQQSTLQYTEEFDFVAMNEKFKKDEVWGYLGKAKQSDKIDSLEDNAIDQSLVDNDGRGMASKFNSKPSYNKDEFFDTISCNSLSRGTRNGQNRFSERMKQDTQTFGNFQPRNHLGYGAGPGRGENYWSSYNRGRGYGYGGRGRGGNMPI